MVRIRYILESTYADICALARLTISRMAGSSTSVFAGASFKDYHERLIGDSDRLPRSLLTGNGGATISNKLSHFFDLRGSSMSIDIGCSTSLAALHLACQSLRNEESEMAIVGGASLLLNPSMFISLSNLAYVYWQPSPPQNNFK